MKKKVCPLAKDYHSMKVYIIGVQNGILSYHTLYSLTTVRQNKVKCSRLEKEHSGQFEAAHKLGRILETNFLNLSVKSLLIHAPPQIALYVLLSLVHLPLFCCSVVRSYNGKTKCRPSEVFQFQNLRCLNYYDLLIVLNQ